MKQRITIKELNKLTDAQKERLREWWIPEWGDHFFLVGRSELEEDIVTGIQRNTTDMETPEYVEGTDRISSLIDDWMFDKSECLPLVSIGQMIAFIQDKKPLKSMAKSRFDKWAVNIDTATLGYKDELSDSLWETVLRIL
jgi:hypothetical protein